MRIPNLIPNYCGSMTWQYADDEELRDKIENHRRKQLEEYMEALEEKDFKKVLFMIDNGDIDANTPSEGSGRNALHLAAELGDEENLDELLKRKGEIFRGDYCGLSYTPLAYAIMAQQKKMAQLISKHPDITERERQVARNYILKKLAYQILIFK